jgi:hypothetical protein
MPFGITTFVDVKSAEAKSVSTKSKILWVGILRKPLLTLSGRVPGRTPRFGNVKAAVILKQRSTGVGAE